MTRKSVVQDGFFPQVGQQQQRARQPLLGRIKQLIHQIFRSLFVCRGRWDVDMAALHFIVWKAKELIKGESSKSCHSMWNASATGTCSAPQPIVIMMKGSAAWNGGQRACGVMGHG